MFFLDRNAVLEFDVGLVPGVVIGSLLAALLRREFKFLGFSDESNMRRSMFWGRADGLWRDARRRLRDRGWRHRRLDLCRHGLGLRSFRCGSGAMGTDFLVDQRGLKGARAQG